MNKGQKVDCCFYDKLRSKPNSKKEEQTIIDLLHNSHYEDRPVEHIMQLISQFHGPFSGSSNSLANITSAIAGADSNLRRLSSNTTQAAQIVNQAVNETKNVINIMNQITAAQMNTPMLRYFVTESQQLHPAVNAYIQQHIGRYPYFQEVSEQVGTMFTIISNQNEIDPMSWLNCGQLPTTNLKTAARMLRVLHDKMFDPIAGSMEDSNNFLNTLMLRAMSCEGNQGKLHPNYSKESPLAHGNNFTMDVFHQKRAEDAIPGVYAKLVNIFGDRLRLLNQIIPVQYLMNCEDKLYNVQIDDGKSVTTDIGGVPKSRPTKEMKNLESKQEHFECEEPEN